MPLALLLLLLLGDAPTWRGHRRRLAPSPQDRHSLLVNNVLGWLALATGLCSGMLLRGEPRFALAPWLSWSGLPLALGGTALRAWAVVTLGPWFTLTVQVQRGQPVVERGPYRLLRHPSYAGADLAFVGVGLAAGNWISPAAYLLPWLAAHLYRIRVEERALLELLGNPYREYCGRSWRLVPFLW
jgi:protein-S-isoprenylcysteine O-methyltransferase